MIRPVSGSQSGFFAAAAVPAPEPSEPPIAARAGAANSPVATNAHTTARATARQRTIFELAIEPPWEVSVPISEGLSDTE